MDKNTSYNRVIILKCGLKSNGQTIGKWAIAAYCIYTIQWAIRDADDAEVDPNIRI